MQWGKRRILGAMVLGLALLAGLLETGRAVYTWTRGTGGGQRYTVVIDPGHGGSLNGQKTRHCCN